MKIHVIFEPNLTADHLTELGLLAERYGIAGVWAQNYAGGPDPFMSLVPLARASRQLQLGVVIVSPYEMHPLKVSTALLTLHELSQGRASIVVGSGGEWLRVMGVDYGRRLTTLREALEIVRGTTHGGRDQGMYQYHGEIYRARYYRAPWVKQVTAPLVYAGVTKDQGLSIGAASADGIMLADLGLPRLAAERVGQLEGYLATHGRARSAVHVSNFVGWHCKTDAAETYREARRELIIRAWLSEKWLCDFLSEEENQFVQTRKRAFLDAYRSRTGEILDVPGVLVDKLIDGLTITGTVDELDRIIDRLRGFANAGLDEIALRLHDDPADALQLLGERVVPYFH